MPTRCRRKCRWSRRSRCPWRRCEHVGSVVVRAALSLTVALLLLLVASLLPDRIVLFCVGATRCCRAHATWLLLAGAGARRSGERLQRHRRKLLHDLRKRRRRAQLGRLTIAALELQRDSAFAVDRGRGLGN